MDVNYSRLVIIPRVDFDNSMIYSLRPKFPSDSLAYYVDCRNILTGLKSVSIVADGLTIGAITVDGSYDADGNILSTSKGTIFSFVLSSGASDTTYVVTALITDISGNQITQKFNLYVSSSELISMNPPLALGPQGIQGNTGATGSDGLSAYQLAVNAGFTGTESEWFLSLKGPKGDTGATPVIDNTTPITVASITSDNGNVKTDGNGKLTAMSVVFSNTTFALLPTSPSIGQMVFCTDAWSQLRSESLTTTGVITVWNGTYWADFIGNPIQIS